MELYNLTKPQKGIYNMEKVIGGTISVICGSYLIEGTMKENDIKNLKRAVNEVYRVNDAFRMQIVEEKGEIKQKFLEYYEQEIGVLYFDDKEKLDEYASVHAKKSMDMHGQLCEIQLLLLPDCYGILVKMHHLVGDAWAIALIGTQFSGYLKGEIYEEHSYTRFIGEEQEYLRSKRYEEDLKYFVKENSKCEQRVYISSKTESTYVAKRKGFVIDDQQTEVINRYVNEKKTSFFRLFMTVVAIYLSKINMNADSVYIGTNVLNRLGKYNKNTGGMFINTLPLLVELDYQTDFETNLNYVGKKCFELLRHQQCNCEEINNRIKSEQEIYGNLYDVVISYQNAQILSGDNTFTTWYHSEMQTESLQIHIDDRDNEGIYRIHYDYLQDRFSEKEIEKLHNTLLNILMQGIIEDQKMIKEIKIISEDEFDIIANQWNDTKYQYIIPENSTLYSLFEKRANQYSDNICISIGEATITFGEFKRRAEQIDNEIRKKTRGKKNIIGVIADRSFEMYIAIYGILRGGNAYLPINPVNPQNRINYIIEDSGASTVCVQEKYIDLVKDISAINVTDVIGTSIVQNLRTECLAEENDTAYVIYTSGSTGKPKGAKISHKSAINRILWMQEMYPMRGNDVILQKTPYTFDVSVWELFWWGICNGRLAASQPDEHFMPDKILCETEKHSVSHLHFVPSVFEHFLMYLEKNIDERKKFHSVEHVFLSGEVLTDNLVRRFYELFEYDKVKLHNLYGPTECAVDVTFYDCQPNDKGRIPIGKPIYNTQIYIIDKEKNIQPIGVVGELCIAGVNVGQGYLNNPILTKEKFIANPFGSGNVYRTGDLAYWREDGNIVFVGRNDNQIKLHGQRIEIGEIENVLASVEGVESVFVLVRKDKGTEKLIAFYTGKATKEKIVEECKNKLANYMIPKGFKCVDTLPINQNGKIDRNILDTIEIEEFDFTEYEPPINDAEKKICELYERILEISGVGRKDNFFDLGGTSLNMISVLSEDYLRGKVSAAEFIANSTPKKLARILDVGNIEKKDKFKKIIDIEGNEEVLVLFPYAGGSEEAYAKLVHSMSGIRKGLSIYYVDFLHSYEECEEIANKLIGITKNKNIYFYAHCAGTSVAMQVLNILEKRNICIENLIAGGFIPLEEPTTENMWSSVGDKMLMEILSKAGADFESLSQQKQKDVLKQFRIDTDFMTEYFCSEKDIIKSKMTTILSKKDLFTSYYDKADKLWGQYLQSKVDIYYVDSESHYFQSTHNQEIARIIVSIMEK